MPNLARILAAVPPAVGPWLRSMDPASPVWDAVGRELALDVSRELLGDDEGDAGYGLGGARRLLWSAPARAVAEGLRIGRRWTPNLVALGACAYFGVYSAADAVRRRVPRLLNKETQIGESPQLVTSRAA